MKILLGALLLGLPLLSYAEVVVPIDSVEQHVNIRLSANPKSEIVGHLEQGDYAELVSSSDGWHEVEIVGGSTGYISADWTKVLSEAPTVAAEGSDENDVIEIADDVVAGISNLSPDETVAEAVKVVEDSDDTLQIAAGEVHDKVASETDSQIPSVALTQGEAQQAKTEPLAEGQADLDQEVIEPITTNVAADASDKTASVAEHPTAEPLAVEEDLSTAVADEMAVDETVAGESPHSVEIDDAVAAGTSVVVAAATVGMQGPPGPPGPAGAGTIKGSENYLVKFSKPQVGTNSQIYDDGNKVGIGTTAPKQRLEVNGSIQIHEQNSSVAGLIITQSSGDTGYIMHNRANTLTIGAGSVDRLTIDRDGNLGVGVARPRHPIEMASGAHVTAGGVWTNSSSRAKKENIQPLALDEAYVTLAQLQPVQFNYKNEQQETYVGFIAEDVPDLVATNDRDSLSTMDIVAVLTKVVQAQQQKIEELERRLDQSEHQ